MIVVPSIIFVDPSAGLQAAIDNAVAGSSVYLPVGTTTLSATITITKVITIVMQAGTIVSSPSTTTAAFSVSHSGAFHLVGGGGTIVGPGIGTAATGARGISLTGTNGSSFSNVTVSGFYTGIHNTNANNNASFSGVSVVDGNIGATLSGSYLSGDLRSDNNAISGVVLNGSINSNLVVTASNNGSTGFSLTNGSNGNCVSLLAVGSTTGLSIAFGCNDNSFVGSSTSNATNVSNSGSRNNVLALNGSSIVATATANDTSPSVLGVRILLIPSNSSPTAISQLDDGVAGQMVTIVWTNATNPSSIADSGNFALSGAAPATLDDTLTLVTSNGTSWYEVSRSVN